VRTVLLTFGKAVVAAVTIGQIDVAQADLLEIDFAQPFHFRPHFTHKLTGETLDHFSTPLILLAGTAVNNQTFHFVTVFS